MLAKAVEKTGYDLVMCGMASTDGTMGVLPAMLAERLGVPQVTLLSEVSVADGKVNGRRDGDTATEQLEAALPAVVSVTDQSGEARYPSFKGIMAAKKKPVESLDLDDLDIEADEVGLEGAWTTVEDATRVRPVPQAPSSRTRARAASSSPPSSRSKVHLGRSGQPRGPEVQLRPARPSDADVTRTPARTIRPTFPQEQPHG